MHLALYRCVENLINLDSADHYRYSLTLLYGAETLRQAEALLARSKRFFGLDALGVDMEGCQMHQTLSAAYDKLFAATQARLQRQLFSFQYIHKTMQNSLWIIKSAPNLTEVSKLSLFNANIEISANRHGVCT